MARLFQNVGANRPGKSVFDLSYNKFFTCDMGQLIPVMHDEVVPGDVFQVGFSALARTQPLAAPLMHDVYMTVHYFFVPYRILAEHSDIGVDWETFITGGSAGTDSSTMPTWNVTTNTAGSLWDFFGFPLSVDAAGARPLIWPLAAYNLIWNEYYRDADIDSEVTINTQEAVLKARWEKDYFTSARPWQIRGSAAALAVDLSGTVNVDATGAVAAAAAGQNYMEVHLNPSTDLLYTDSSGSAVETDLENALAKQSIDLSDGSATSIDLADLRLALAINRYMELSARAGYRYFEWLRAHFGHQVPNMDARYDRPEYLGGQKLWLVTQAVPQSSETNTTPQGTLTGTGVIAASENICKFRVPEFGLIMGMFCVRPKSGYYEGINRQWMRETRYDYYNPAFANLSEQPILESELYCSGTEAHHNTVFGYQGRYDEMRYKPDIACNGMRPSGAYDHYNIIRHLGARPSLNASFLECTPAENWCSDSSEPHLIVRYRNMIRAVRPLPFIAVPGGRL